MKVDLNYSLKLSLNLPIQNWLMTYQSTFAGLVALTCLSYEGWGDHKPFARHVELTNANLNKWQGTAARHAKPTTAILSV